MENKTLPETRINYGGRMIPKWLKIDITQPSNGGEGRTEPVPLYKYTKKGKLIIKYGSMSEASKKVGISVASISKHLKRYGYYNKGRYIYTTNPEWDLDI